MEIILVRHALPLRIEKQEESDKSKEESEEEFADPPLAPIGVEQAERLADWLAIEEIDHIAVSPKLRARETAAPLAKQLGLEPEIIGEFSEIDRSARLYIPIEEMRRENHPQYQKLMNREWDSAGFMDPKEFQKEVLGAYKKLVDRWQEGNVIVVVSHGGTINAIVSAVMEMKDTFFFEPSYTSITRLKPAFGGNKDQLRLSNLNGTAHLYATRETLNPLDQL